MQKKKSKAIIVIVIAAIIVIILFCFKSRKLNSLYAGNISDTKMIGTDGSGIHGIIVEDHAPEITFSVNWQ